MFRSLTSLPLVATVVFAAAVTLAGGSHKRVTPIDASMRASMARHVVETGQLFPPHYDGEPLLDHPPGYIWSIAAAFKVFGVNDFAAQLPGRLAAFLSLLLVWATARRLGLGPMAAFFAVFVLGTTRDFLIISFQGGIEPLLSLWCWLGFYLILPGSSEGGNLRGNSLRPALSHALAGLCVVLAAFTKGPPALLPLVFLPFCILLWAETWAQRLIRLGAYTSMLVAASALWALYIFKSGDLWYWQWYWKDQVLGSALKGRNMQTELNLTYFVKILSQQYWPWLALLIAGVAVKLKAWRSLRFRDPVLMTLLLSLGFLAGFSLVKWKFWYYIAPCFPGFAVFIAAMFESNGIWQKVTQKLRLEKSVLVLSCCWIITLSIFPISLSGNRLPEIQVFKETLRYSPVKGPVWFVDHPGDHNMYATSGNWYFNRVVRKVGDTSAWEKNLGAPVWVMVGADNFRACQRSWCRRVTFSQTIGQSTLALVEARRAN